MGIGFFGSLIVGGLAGWLASIYMKADTGIIVNIILGIVGAGLLNMVLGWIGIYAASAWIPQLVVGFVGASILIAAFRKFSS